MANESYQQKLRRVRPPRVQIKYEVYTDGATVVKELPFVVGVMGDFSGQPTEELPDLRDRSFVNIDRDNFDEVMSKFKAGLQLRVENKISGNPDEELAVALKFQSMADFEPAKVAEQIPELRELLDMRNKLRDLAIDVDRKRDLEKLLEKILEDPQQQAQLRKELGLGESAGDGQGES